MSLRHILYLAQVVVKMERRESASREAGEPC